MERNLSVANPSITMPNPSNTLSIYPSRPKQWIPRKILTLLLVARTILALICPSYLNSAIGCLKSCHHSKFYKSSTVSPRQRHIFGFVKTWEISSIEKIYIHHLCSESIPRSLVLLPSSRYWGEEVARARKEIWQGIGRIR
jgi:hypothetical protein